jgi:hypothetical protein
MRTGAPKRIATLLVGVVAGGAALGCGLFAERAPEASATLRLPGSSRPATVENVAIRGDYIDATLVFASFEYRMLFARSERCTVMLQPEAAVVYEPRGVLGVVRDEGEGSCSATGILNVAGWVTQRRPTTAGLRTRGIPRENVSFQVGYRDEQLAFVRGTFGLAAHLGFTGIQDLNMILPRDESCDVALERRRATLQFSRNDRPPYRLFMGEAVCEVLGFAMP